MNNELNKGISSKYIQIVVHELLWGGCLNISLQHM